MAIKEMHIMVPKTVRYEQVGPRRYLILHESNYNSHMPCIRNQMIQDGYEYYNVESLGGGFYKYMYVKRDVLPKPIVWDWRILIHFAMDKEEFLRMLKEACKEHLKIDYQHTEGDYHRVGLFWDKELISEVNLYDIL